MRDGRIVEVMEVVGVEGSRVLFERYLPLHDTVLKRYRVASDMRAQRTASSLVTRGREPARPTASRARAGEFEAGCGRREG